MNILHITQGNQQSKSYQNASVIFKVVQVILKFVWKHKRSQVDKDIQRKNRTESIILPDVRLQYKVTVNKQHAIYTNTHTNQWNRIQSPEIKPHSYGQLIYNRGNKIKQCKKVVSSISCSGRTGQVCVKE